MDRIIMLLDMDCFYVQVEQRLQPETKGKPCIVSQYNDWKAVSYEARALDIKRGMFADTLKAKFPDLVVFKIPEKRGKAELSKYRTASIEIFKCISEFTNEVERASIDEAYVDLTVGYCETSVPPNSESFLLTSKEIADSFNASLTSANCISLDQVNWSTNLVQHFTDGKRLITASSIVYQIRQKILQNTGFQCSAGIASNKTLAKLACSLNKPNKQTIVPVESISILLNNTPIRKIRNLGGKLGSSIVEQFKIQTLGELNSIPINLMKKTYGEKIASWLYDLSNGIDNESVTARAIPKSLGCSKNFMGRQMLVSTERIVHWIKCLVEELVERLVVDCCDYQRFPVRFNISVRTAMDKNSISRVLSSHETQTMINILRKERESEKATGETTVSITEKYSDQINSMALAVLRHLKEIFSKTDDESVWDPGIIGLGLYAGKFASCQPTSSSSNDIKSLLGRQSSSKSVKDQELGEQNERIDDHNSSSFDEFTTLDPKTDDCSSNDTCPKNTGLSFFKRLLVAELSESTGTSNSNVIGSNSKTRSVQMGVKSNESCERIPAAPPLLTCESKSDSHSDSNSSRSDSVKLMKYSTGDWTICDQCKSRVSVWQLPEHQDFHFAQSVQREWYEGAGGGGAGVGGGDGQKMTTVPSVSNSTVQKSKSSTTKVPSGKKPKLKQSNTLDKFVHKFS